MTCPGKWTHCKDRAYQSANEPHSPILIWKSIQSHQDSKVISCKAEKINNSLTKKEIKSFPSALLLSKQAKCKTPCLAKALCGLHSFSLHSVEHLH